MWRAVPGMVGLVGLLCVVFAFAPGAFREPDRPCPHGSRAEHPTVVRLVPSVIQHRSWVGVPPDGIPLNAEMLVCVDGRALGRNLADEGNLRAPVAEIYVPTRWVARQFLSGRLSEYQDPDRWLVIVAPFEEPT